MIHKVLTIIPESHSPRGHLLDLVQITLQQSIGLRGGIGTVRVCLQLSDHIHHLRYSENSGCSPVLTIGHDHRATRSYACPLHLRIFVIPRGRGGCQCFTVRDQLPRDQHVNSKGTLQIPSLLCKIFHQKVYGLGHLMPSIVRVLNDPRTTLSLIKTRLPIPLPCDVAKTNAYKALQLSTL